MTKLFSNKKLAYVLIGILLALQLTQSIANWCGGGFNGGSLVLCILMLGLLTLVGVGIAKENKLLTIISGVSILSVVAYVSTANYSGLAQKYIDGKIPVGGLITSIFGAIGVLLLIGCLILAILKAFKINKNLNTINTVFSVLAAIVFLPTIIIPMFDGRITAPELTVCTKVYKFACDFFMMFIALLIPCVWHQVEAKD